MDLRQKHDFEFGETDEDFHLTHDYRMNLIDTNENHQFDNSLQTLRLANRTYSIDDT